MKKRSILMTVLAIALVAVISVGATLAFLTATDSEVTNTFQFADGMTVKIEEPTPSPVADEKITPKDPENPGKGYEYTNIVPGQKLQKEPTISTTTSVPAYVFVKISGATDKVQPVEITNGWTALVNGTSTTNFNGVYYKLANGTGANQSLGAIFEQVQVSNEILTNKPVDGKYEVTLDPITIDVFEIQKGGFTSVEAAYNETDWGKTAPIATPAPVTPETPETPVEG